MIRYAIISDIHGNLTALNAVLDDIKEQNIDRIICLGDTISKGSKNHECVELVRSVVAAAVRGNNDIIYTKSLDEIADASENFNYDLFYNYQRQLTAEDINYLRSLPHCCEFMLSNRLVRCFHATPYDEGKSVFHFDSIDKKKSLFLPTEYTSKTMADVVIYGHTHMQSFEKLFGRTIINAGSVGNALNILWDDDLNAEKIGEFTMAEYLIISGVDGANSGEFGVEFRSVRYDKDKVLGCVNFDREEDYKNEIMCGRYRFPNRIK